MMFPRKTITDDQLFIDDDGITLNTQLQHSRCSSGVHSHALYTGLDFGRLIKQNPFESDIKLYKPANPPLIPLGVLCREQKVFQISAEVKPKGMSVDNSYLSSESDESSTSEPSKEKELPKIPLHRVPDATPKRAEVRRVSIDVEGNRRQSFHMTGRERRGNDKFSNSDSFSSNASEKNTKTFPAGILKMGDKSRFSRDFDDTPKASKRENSLRSLFSLKSKKVPQSPFSKKK